MFLEGGSIAADVDEEPPLPLYGTPFAGVGETVCPSTADPAPDKEALLFPPEYGPVGVRFAREGAAAAEGLQRRCEKLAGYRRHVVLPPCWPEARVEGTYS